MHIPEQFGGYPLVLRNSEAINTRNGELLMDYNNSDLYYVDKYSKEKVRVADSIYKKLLDIKLQNSKINICKDNKDVECDESIIPPIEYRVPNNFYFNITRAAIVSND